MGNLFEIGQQFKKKACPVCGREDRINM